MKPLLAFLTVALLGTSAFACGDSNRTARTSTNIAELSDGHVVGVAANATPSLRHLKGDEDDEDTSAELENGGTKADSDNDTDNDRKANAGKGYYDSDDSVIETFGHPASAADSGRLATLARRYFAAARAGDGPRACSMIAPTFVKAIPEDFGKAPGPVYLRGTRCAVIMSKLFKHVHDRLTGAVQIVAMRVEGDSAHVQYGSTTMPAGYLILKLEHGVWGVNQLLGGPLP
jgi:hypothetical protein